MSTKTDTKTQYKTPLNWEQNIDMETTKTDKDMEKEFGYVITSHNQIDPSITHQYLTKKYSDKELTNGCANFFFKWNPPTIEDPTPNVMRLFKHMERLNWENDDKHSDLMNYLLGDRKLIKELMSIIDKMEEDIIKNNPKFDEDDIFDQLYEDWNEYWMMSFGEEPLLTLWVSFISMFYPTLKNEYIQYVINGEKITDEYVSGYDEELLKKVNEEIRKDNEELNEYCQMKEKEEVKEVA